MDKKYGQLNKYDKTKTNYNGVIITTFETSKFRKNKKDKKPLLQSWTKKVIS